MKVRVLIACALVACAPAAASAAVTPGTAEFATPARGTAVVAPGVASVGAAYVPYTGRRTFTLFARLPRARFPMRAYVRHTAARGRCARSFAADRGTALAFGFAVPDARGFLTQMSREVPWPRAGRHRFCIWLSRSPRAPVRPITQVVRFVDRATGGAQFGWSDPDGTSGIATYIASTDPYSLAARTTGCPPDTSRDYGVLDSVRTLSELIEFTSFDFASRPCVNSVTFSVSGSSAGAFDLSLDDTQAAQGAVRRGGDGCVLPAVGESEAVARALVVAQGCRVGRVVRAPKSSTPPDRVWAYAVAGAPAHLVPPGTRVDLVVTPA